MNKILVSNFPYPSQQFVLQHQDDPSLRLTIVHGFESRKPLQRSEICPRIASDILQAVLIHDCVAVELDAVYDLVQTFDFSNTIKLLQAGCFELIDHGGFNPALMKGKSKYGLLFLDGATIRSARSSLERLESHLSKKYPENKTEINLLMLQVEKHRKIVNLQKDETESIFKKEIDFDLQNQNMVTAYGFSSKSHNEIEPADVYKVLRLLFINKFLLLSNLAGALAVKVDGEAKSLLQQKISPIVQGGITHDPVNLFNEILQNKGIPDLSGLFISGLLSIEDVLSLRENINGEKFRNWFVTTHYDPAIVHRTLISKSVPQPVLTKLLRFIIPNAIGIANAPLGLVAGAIDSFLIDKILGGWHPNIFLDDHLKSQIDIRLKEHSETTRRNDIKSRFPNVGRNDSCPCGSGEKFKHCCGQGL